MRDESAGTEESVSPRRLHAASTTPGLPQAVPPTEVLANALWYHIPSPQGPDCNKWPVCSLDRDHCTAIAVMGRGNSPNQQKPQGQCAEI